MRISIGRYYGDLIEMCAFCSEKLQIKFVLIKDERDPDQLIYRLCWNDGIRLANLLVPDQDVW